ncbi:RnfABCDGE type electron transport complex subunit D [Alkaliphilus hydrothermalis]|uniref:Na+-transporting NADH:ubiquinone oxidoreductase subunit B n=1 Tax=Alkaliphilus hydrothermalis TaxID=1482730 RepID=A0ABS2NPN1_9FIRM|nr:RnfABCDGE type electron transport complex subunit D [Alkaliphilus hydrothermalis]MBM7614890.1 Na+-transporting NADH:ubiquinone oxidoreductase subunit B [Alkaliphilus hydrothermalis]
MEIKTKDFFMKQNHMRKILISLIPIILGAIYFFGWRTLVLMSVVTSFGILTEYAFKRKRNQPVSEAVIVTSILFTLTLPVSIPFWVAIVGIIFGVIFATEVFGGYGFNVFNPALVARTFLYICFPQYITVAWNAPSAGFPGGFASYITPAIETITQATPLKQTVPISQLFWGNVSGSMGETSAFLIMIAAIILLVTKAIDWQLLLSPLVGFIGMSAVSILIAPAKAPSIQYGLLSGAFLMLAVFFVTDGSTAPKTVEGKWIYGILIGTITVIIRVFGIFVGGAMFAVLIMNTFVPIMDEGIKYLKEQQRKQVSL